MKTVVLFAWLLLLVLAASAAPSADHSNTLTLRQALHSAGLDSALSAADAPNPQRPLTSSAFALSADSFVAAYYFADEQTAGGGLGPLHLSRYDRVRRHWHHAAPFDDELRGSVLGLQIAGPQLLLELHLNPSAGRGIILDTATLAPRTVVAGYALQPLSEEAVLYKANMIHFAPTHQEQLMFYNTGKGIERKIFPADTESTAAQHYRQRIQARYAALDQAQKQQYESSAYGPVDDFDRSLLAITPFKKGSRLAFIVRYSNRLPAAVAPAALQTLVTCGREAEQHWTCHESGLVEAAHEAGIPLACEHNGCGDETELRRLISQLLTVQ